MGARAAESRSDDEELHQKSVLRDYTETILVCVIFVIFSRTFVFQQSKIPSGSMMDTLLIGDYIMVNRFVYGATSFDWERNLFPLKPVERGEVIVFKHPPEPQVDYIKRVIGLPGDTVELRNGYLHVNGELVSEPYVKEAYRRADPRRNYGPVTVKPGHYLVMGDHRNASSDSREWGQVPAELIKGRALLIWWSFEEAASTDITVGEQVRSWGQKIRYFFSRSRWSRMFDLIR